MSKANDSELEKRLRELVHEWMADEVAGFALVPGVRRTALYKMVKQAAALAEEECDRILEGCECGAASRDGRKPWEVIRARGKR